MSYPSLNNQLCIGGVYVRLLLEGGDASELLGYRSLSQGSGLRVPCSACCLVVLQLSRSGWAESNNRLFHMHTLEPRASLRLRKPTYDTMS